jgi:uncharacterized protein (TIGR01615 family)
MAAHCSSSTTGSDHAIDMISGYGIFDQHGSQGEFSPSIFTEDSEGDAKGSNTRDFMAIFREQLREILEGVSCSSNTAFEMHLLRDAEKAEALAKAKAGFNVPENAEQKSRSRRFVMNSLRLAGYDAAICKSRWDQTIGHPAGDYEFIDVIIEQLILKNERFFVDIDFRVQFEIARPTDEYNALLQKIPNLFVGRADKLCGIVKIMCNAARRSLRERGMYIPPWRKYRYMQAKWVGSYKRTTNPGSSGAQGALLQFPFSGIALKATRCDASVARQINKDNSATDRYINEKSKCTKKGNEQLESRDRLSTGGEKNRHLNKISGLATALADAGLTPSSPSTESDTIL